MVHHPNGIDSFLTNYPGCTEILGSLVVDDSHITNLNALSVLTSIGGLLTISNSSLTSLTGLYNVTSIGGDLNIIFNYLLSRLAGLEGLHSIGGNLTIKYNSPVTSLTGLDNVTSVGGDLDIFYNYNLSSLAGLGGLNSIGGSLTIDYNSVLTSLTGLEGLTSIGGGLKIEYNSSLTSLTGLNNIDAGTISYLVISENSFLSTCAVQSICDFLAPQSGNVGIQNNAAGCNSVEEVNSACVNLSSGDALNLTTFSLYTNPASTTITIETPAKGSIYIHSINGQQLLHQEITQPTTAIDVRGLKSEVFLVKVVGSEGVQVG